MPRLRHPSLPVAAGACLALAALSLVVADQPAYDPTAWLIWGRQISEGTLDTVAGPSWKPLPVLVTAPAALLGDDAARWIWLAVARAGGLMALVLAFRLAARLGGAAGGAVAVVALLLAETFASGVVRGNSEGLLVALVLLGLDRHLDGRHGAAFGAGVTAALLRPEAWPFVALQGLWLLRGARAAGGAAVARTAAVLAAAGAGVLALWFIPERIGSGDFLRAASRALEPVEGSPAESSRPFVAVFVNAAPALAYPVYLLAVAAVIAAWRRRDRAVLLVAGVSAGWMLVVAVLAELGFTGNLRYITVPAATLCVVAGAGVPVVAAWLRPRRRLAVAAAVLAVPGVALAVATVARETERVASDERLYDALPAAIERAGGPAAVNRCGVVLTGPFQTQAVARELERRQVAVGLRGDPPGTVLSRSEEGVGADARFGPELGDGRWVVRSTCAREPLGAGR